MLKRNIVANYLGQSWAAIMGLAFIPVYIKQLGIESYGLIGFYTVLQTSLSLLDFGLAQTVGREVAHYTGGGRSLKSVRELLRTVEYISVAILFLIIALFLLTSSQVAEYWLNSKTIPVETVSQIVQIMGFVIGLRIVEGIYRSAIISLQKQVLYNIANAIFNSLRWAGAAGILLWYSPSLEAFFIWQGIVSLLALFTFLQITYFLLPKINEKIRFSYSILIEIKSFAAGIFWISLLSILITQSDKIILSKILNLEYFGIYSLAASVAGALYLLITPITQAFYPRLCEVQSKGKLNELSEIFHQGAQLVSIVAGSAALVLMFFSEALINVWMQDKSVNLILSPLIALLVFGNLLNGIMFIPYQTQLAFGWTSLTLKLNAVIVIVMIPAIIWAAPKYGGVGAAYIWIILNLFYIFIGMQLMFRSLLTKDKFKWYFNDVLLPLTAALISLLLLKWIYGETKTIASSLILLVLAYSISTISACMVSNEIRRKVILVLTNYYVRYGNPPSG